MGSDGALSGLAAGVCTVQARFVGDNSKGASGWADSPDITVEKGTQSAPADNATYYGASAEVAKGGTLELTEAPVGYGTARLYG